MIYTVEVFREDDAWVADVTNLEGAHTYAKNLKVLDAAVREVIGLIEDLPDDVRIEVEYKYVNVDDIVLRAAEFGERRAEAEAEQVQLGVEAVLHATRLAEAQYSVRDISGLLRMSPGRVSQITKELA